MKTLMFAIYDAKTEAYLQPFFLPTVGSATRAFETACNDSNTQFFNNPEDYTLFQIGEFDQTSATVTDLVPNKPLGTAIEYKKGE